MKYLLIPFVLVSHSAVAQQCPVDELAQYTWGNAVSGPAGQVNVEADGSVVTQKTATFTGNVVAKRGQEIFHSDKIIYDRVTRDIDTPVSMTYGTPDFAIRSDKADYSLAKQNGTFKNVDYFLTKNNINGEAEQLDVDRKANTEDLKQAIYSTCPRLSRAWSIKAKRVHLDHNEGVGETWNTTFRLGKVPVFYFPYFNFPLDDRRKTGFLLPLLNYSDDRGIDITAPYYINIAPNQDATLWPRIMGKRGFMLGAEYRYLLKDLSGKLSGTYLFEDKRYDGDRWSFNTEHNYQPNDKFSISARYQRVSDKDYIDDFEDTLDLSDANFIASHLRATYAYSPNYRLKAEFKHYQVADGEYDDSQKPYSMLPKLSGNGQWSFDNGLVFNSDTELTHFDKDDVVSGWRFDQLLTASYPIERTYGFIKPSASYRMTHYQLRDQDSDVSASQTRSLPTFSIDSGLYFDRPMTWFGHNATQSLEPRLYYLYTPYRNQSDIPDFDTAAINTSYEAMFFNNRFTGKDRVGDANQLTTAVSTKVTDNDSGKELASLAVGQIQYFEDRNVSLLDSVSDASRSNVIAEARMQVYDDIRLRGFVHYDADERHAEKSLLGVTYSPDSDKSISVSHLYDEDNYKQVDFAGIWRINDQWRTFWRWNYSIEYSKTSDAFAGIEYVDCCWGMRLIARHYRDSLTDEDKTPENAVYLEFALKGLGNIGSDTTTMLRDVIPNYRGISYEKPQ